MSFLRVPSFGPKVSNTWEINWQHVGSTVWSQHFVHPPPRIWWPLIVYCTNSQTPSYSTRLQLSRQPQYDVPSAVYLEGILLYFVRRQSQNQAPGENSKRNTTGPSSKAPLARENRPRAPPRLSRRGSPPELRAPPCRGPGPGKGETQSLTYPFWRPLGLSWLSCGSNFCIKWWV